MPETRTCSLSGKRFTISEEDLAFYNKISVPPPTLCPEERERRRLVWRNERFLYPRVCGLCDDPMISVYPLECPFPVYCETCFWSDQWSATDYGRAFDFSRPFFDQFKALAQVVPRLALNHVKSENSTYTLNSIGNKNCYLTSGADYNEDCLYGVNSQRSKDCIDTYLIYDSQLSYGCLDSTRVYESVGCQNSENVINSWFLYDCIGCRHCAFSSNLRNKEYVLFNQPLLKAEYEQALPKVLSQLFKHSDWLTRGLAEVREKAIHRAARVLHSENATGDHLRQCKNTHYAFDGENLEDCKYAYYAIDVQDGYDISCLGFESSLLYEVMSGTNAYNCKFCNALFFVEDIQYGIACFHSKHAFGAISLRREDYVILNQSYSKEEFIALRERVVDYMKHTGEYGEFFPAQLAPFEYNRSAANDYMPLNQKEVEALGFRWHKGESYRVSGVGEARTCARCGDPYRLVEQELSFYKRLEVPEPQLCWGCRLKNLIAARRPRRLSPLCCHQCGAMVSSPYTEQQYKKILCEVCYLKTVY